MKLTSMKLRYVALGVAAAFVVAFVIAPATAQVSTAHAAPRTTTTTTTATTTTNPALSVPITGQDASGDTFSGTFTVQRFVHEGHGLGAAGLLSGTLTSTTGSAIGTVTNVPVTLPVSAGDPTCSILNLVLGPLDLNLLGLMVHLNQVVLTITAQSGAGNLLGNLLCAVANLLNGSAPLSALTGLLNHIISILNGL